VEWVVCVPGVSQNSEPTWARAVLMAISYADWISLNEPRLVMIRRSMNQLDLSRYSEAIGDLMSLQLVVDGEPDPSLPAHAQQRINADLPPVTTHLPTSDLLPPIHFHGSSVQASGAMTYPAASSASFVRGVVRLTADDPPQVRWTLVIRYGGEDRWRLEGVQVGGRGAKRGFFGVSAVSELGEGSLVLACTCLARPCSSLLVPARSSVPGVLQRTGLVECA
jgi:hypothetical protein